MASISDFLFNGQPPPSVTSTTESQTGLPTWYQDFVRGLASKSSAIAATPYQAFPGPTVAATDPLQKQAWDQVGAANGQFQPAVQSGLSTLSNISAGGNSTVNPLMDSIARLGTRNLTENLLPAVNNTFIGAGQFGSSRMQDFMGRATRDTQEAVLNAQAGALLQNQGQQISAAQGMGTLGTAGQTMNLRDIAALDTAGQESQTQNQSNINAGINQFNQELQYPYQQSYFMSDILRGLNPPQSQTTSTTTPFQGQLQPSGLATLAGSALTAQALSSLFKARGGPIRYRGGGHVRRYAPGGLAALRPGAPSPLIRRASPARAAPVQAIVSTGPTRSRFAKAVLPRARQGALGYLREPRV